MTQSVTSMRGSCGSKRVGVAVEELYAADAEPAVKARRLRELAAWYRAFAARAANPVIWESRLLTAELLDAEANRIDPQRDNPLAPL